MVLLKNDGQLLPLTESRLRRILVTGPAADKVLQGGGSGSVPAAVEISPLEGLRVALAGKVEVAHVPYHASLVPQLDQGSVEWTPPAAKRKAGRTASRLHTSPGNEVLQREARLADAVIFLAASTVASEGRDLLTFDLPSNQADAIATLARVNRNVVVVLVNNGAVSVETWFHQVKSILAIHYSGEATGDALADVLLGRVNPSGKLTYTFGKRLGDYPAHALGQWPARLILDKEPGPAGMTPAERKVTHAYDADYKEGVFAGYRWFDYKKIEPRYPFGFGLSYTTFKMTDLTVTGEDPQLRISCCVKNTGSREGAEVVQVYIVPPQRSSVARPVKELKGFSKVSLQPGESRRVEVVLRPGALGYYDIATKQWKADAGVYGIHVGNSSRDIRLQSRIVLTHDQHFEHY
jgi:beta-glucosidase